VSEEEVGGDVKMLSNDDEQCFNAEVQETIRAE
jgi:hypothetical protein